MGSWGGGGGGLPCKLEKVARTTESAWKNSVFL